MHETKLFTVLRAKRWKPKKNLLSAEIKKKRSNKRTTRRRCRRAEQSTRTETKNRIIINNNNNNNNDDEDAATDRATRLARSPVCADTADQSTSLNLTFKTDRPLVEETVSPSNRTRPVLGHTARSPNGRWTLKVNATGSRRRRRRGIYNTYI